MEENIGRYRIVRPLGRGAMGVVYLAEDPVLNRQVAIKMVELAVDDSTQRDFLRERLLRDAKAAAALSHPNIVSIFDVIEEGDRAYVVMEYLPGESLAATLRRDPKPEPAFVIAVLRQMASALDYTHARGIIHRDIKPGNVMFDGHGSARILDFGIARLADGRTTTPTGVVMGTVEYMAPEQIKAEPVDGRADQFALAAVAYQMLTGATMFGQHTLATLAYKLVNEMPPAVSSRNSALPVGLDSVLLKALSKSPADRYPSCSAFVQALEDALLGRQPATAPLTAAAPVAAAPARKSPIGVIAAAVGALAIAGGGLAMWKPWATPEQAKTVAVAPAPVPAPQQQPTIEMTVQPRNTKTTVPKPQPPPSAPAAEVDPNAGDPAYLKGMKLIQSGDNQGAIQSFTEVLSRHPKSARAFLARGQAHEHLGQNPAAIEDYSRAIQLRPKDTEAYVDQGVAYVRMHDDEHALADFNAVIAMRSEAPRALMGRGGIYLRRRQYPLALHDLDEALRLNPNLLGALNYRAQVRAALGDRAGAAEDRKKASELRGKAE